MKMFLGEYQPNLVDKARLALPAKLREQLSSSEIVLTRGFEQCLFGYESSAWEAEARKHIDSPISNTKTRNLKRYLYSGAVRVNLDSQGRFVIPPSLKSYARLNREVTVIGAGDHFEIWDTATWQKHLETISRQALDDED